MTGLSHKNASVRNWIFCAQAVALIFRLFAIAVIYLIGKDLVGQKLSFWAVLILILLPKPAENGSDALSDWPHLFFLSIGFLLLMRGAMDKKWWLFGFVGLVAGAGYLIRPECAQLIIYGSLWLGLQLLWPKRTMGRAKTAFALALLIVGFLVTTWPYMKSKGAIFPKKEIGQFTSKVQPYKPDKPDEQQTQTFLKTVEATKAITYKILRALDKLIENIGDVLMWFFLPPLLIGTYKWFKNQKWYEPGKFFSIVLIALNISLMVWLYCAHGYISTRHVLPLVVFTIFHIPAGLQVLAIWLEKSLLKGQKRALANRTDTNFWFSVLLIIGVLVCIPKLLRPMRTEKRSFRYAAQWLSEHTEKNDIIAVPDLRISFYAQRKGLEYETGQIPAQAQYIVETFKNKDYTSDLPEDTYNIEYEYVDKSKGKASVVIYRKLNIMKTN